MTDRLYWGPYCVLPRGQYVHEVYPLASGYDENGPLSAEALDRLSEIYGPRLTSSHTWSLRDDPSDEL